MLKVRSLRFRIALSYIAGTLAVSGFIAGGTLYITRAVLTRQSVQAAINSSLAQVEFVRDQILDHKRNVSDIEATLQQRGLDVVVARGSLEPESTSIGITYESIPAKLRESVQGGDANVDHAAYAIFKGPGYREIAFGASVPDVEPLYTYFVYPLERDDQTLGLLWRVLAVIVALAAAIAGAVGVRLADRTIKPLRAASDAARRVAEGNLETRLEESHTDELGQLAGAFNRMTLALNERIERERRFVADVSHELRTPLTALKTSIDYLADRVTSLPPRISSAVGLAADEVRSLQRLVDDLLELTRAEAGGVHVSREEVDLVDFSRELAKRRAPETAVIIDGPQRLIVETDKMRLERVVGNLVENAVVHGAGKEVRISLESSNGAATISVIDQGPGIDKDKLPNIFERFYRGDASRRRDGRVGAGLGLAIARENAGLIGAELRVASVAGEGTRFEVVLRRQEEA